MAHTILEKVAKVAQDVDVRITEAKESKHRQDANEILKNLVLALSSTVSHMKEKSKGKLVKLRGKVAIMQNAIQGIVDGLDDGELSRKELKSALDNASRFHADLVAVLNGEEEALAEASGVSNDLNAAQQKAAVKISASGDWQAALGTIKKALAAPAPKPTVRVAEKAVDDPDAATKAEINELKNKEDDLPVRLSSAYSIVRMPVVPLFSSVALNVATLRTIGLHVVSIEGYAILKDQLLLAVTKKEADAHGLSVSEFAESIISVLSEKGSVAYSLVSDQYALNPRNKNIFLFWIMPRARVAVLTRSAGMSIGKVKWGLPF